MYKYTNTIFNQLLSFLPRYKFDQFVGQHKGDRYVKKLTTWNQLTALLYAQATGKNSLRDIETGMKLHKNSGIILVLLQWQSRVYHMPRITEAMKYLKNYFTPYWNNAKKWQ